MHPTPYALILLLGFVYEGDNLTTVNNSLLVGGKSLPSTLGKRLLQANLHILHIYDGAHFQVATQNHCVEQAGVTHLCALLGSVDGVDVDVFTSGVVGDTVGIVDEVTTGADISLELIQTLLVKYDDGVAHLNNGRAYGLVANHNGYIC